MVEEEDEGEESLRTLQSVAIVPRKEKECHRLPALPLWLLLLWVVTASINQLVIPIMLSPFPPTPSILHIMVINHRRMEHPWNPMATRGRWNSSEAGQIGTGI